MGECPPIFKGEILNATKGTNTNFFDLDLLPTQSPTTFLMYFYPESGNSGFPSIKRTNGGNTTIEPLGTNVVNYTMAPYMFQFLVAPGDSINLINPDGPAKIKTLIVVEIETPSGTLFQTHMM